MEVTDREIYFLLKYMLPATIVLFSILGLMFMMESKWQKVAKIVFWPWLLFVFFMFWWQGEFFIFSMVGALECAVLVGTVVLVGESIHHIDSSLVQNETIEKRIHRKNLINIIFYAVVGCFFYVFCCYFLVVLFC